jgi:hypothetical protein
MLLLICGLLKGKTRNTTYPHQALSSTKCGKSWVLPSGLIILTLLKACIAFLKKEPDRLNADQHHVPFYLFQIKQCDDAKTCCLNANMHQICWICYIEYVWVERLALEHMCWICLCWKFGIQIHVFRQSSNMGSVEIHRWFIRATTWHTIIGKDIVRASVSPAVRHPFEYESNNQWQLLYGYLLQLVGARGRRPLWSPPWVPVTFGHSEVL